MSSCHVDGTSARHFFRWTPTSVTDHGGCGLTASWFYTLALPILTLTLHLQEPMSAAPQGFRSRQASDAPQTPKHAQCSGEMHYPSASSWKAFFAGKASLGRKNWINARPSAEGAANHQLIGTRRPCSMRKVGQGSSSLRSTVAKEWYEPESPEV